MKTMTAYESAKYQTWRVWEDLAQLSCEFDSEEFDAIVAEVGRAAGSGTMRGNLAEALWTLSEALRTFAQAMEAPTLELKNTRLGILAMAQALRHIRDDYTSKDRDYRAGRLF